MRTKASVLWIDDNDRASDAKALSDSSVHVEFKRIDEVQNGDLKTELSGRDLLLIDYKLDEVTTGQRTADGRKHELSLPRDLLRGPTLLGFLRSFDDDTPAYLVTNAPDDARARFTGLFSFDGVFPLSEVQDAKVFGPRLRSDIAAYRAIRAVPKSGRLEEAIIALLDVPDVSIEAILDVIPATVKASLHGHSSEQSAELQGRRGFARWIRRTLLERPGPLLPTLYAATRVGMKETRFKASRAFSKCVYRGIFAGSISSRWWSAAIDSVLYQDAAARKVPVGPPWEIGPLVYRIRPADRLKCAVCGSPNPELVARDSADSTTEAAVHQRCSRPDSSRDLAPFFLEDRVFDQG